MVEFIYTIGEESFTLSTTEKRDPKYLVYEVEKMLLAALNEKGLEIDPSDKRYLQSRIAIAIARDLLSKASVDLGAIKVKPKGPSAEEKPPTEVGDTYTLINIKDGRLAKRSYRSDQSIGAVIADIRRLYDLGLNDNIIIYQVVNGEKRELSPETRITDLIGRELHWDTRKYD